MPMENLQLNAHAPYNYNKLLPCDTHRIEKQGTLQCLLNKTKGCVLSALNNDA